MCVADTGFITSCATTDVFGTVLEEFDVHTTGFVANGPGEPRR